MVSGGKMRWKTGRRSSNVKDRRNGGGGMPTSRIGGQRLPIRRRTATGGELGLLLVALPGLVVGVDPSL
jgi:hypothetical protein